ncbi:hypothetical protein HK096_003438 [Nowakowskiella sp. JEL0078]|nr:hypothetical protein HK096_003438 [Nowakowskiella sp. JEL0078]
MAVDGVAPRAKMNQQRSRRFRSAKDQQDATRKALAKGEVLPDKDPFDSNCITPGTPFMVRLSEQLQYFIHKKITEDAAWRDVTVILSGQDVPGEGEHKIMDYIRRSKSQPDYQPNMRHCLYGLDADLIMLGLLSHEPHFALLREEVTFGRSRKKSFQANPDSITFQLFHLSLFREYLDLEFSQVRESLDFKYDLERVIDDFVLMGFFVGNDFLPHLPKLHINEGALTLMFRAYKKILPKAGGYLHDVGNLDMKRLELLLIELAEYEKEVFEQESGDVDWAKGKRSGGRGRGGGVKGQRRRKVEVISTELDTEDDENEEDEENEDDDKAINKTRTNWFFTAITPSQREILSLIKDFTSKRQKPTEDSSSSEELMKEPLTPLELVFDSQLPAKDRNFIKEVANHLHLRCGTLGDSPETRSLFIAFNDDEDSSDEEGFEARQRVFKNLEEVNVSEKTQVVSKDMNSEFEEWKRNYYKVKQKIFFL